MSLIEGDFSRRRPAGSVAPDRRGPGEVAGLPGLWFWGNTALDVRWHNDGVELRALARGDA